MTSDLVARILRDRVVVRAWAPKAAHGPGSADLRRFQRMVAAGDWAMAWRLASHGLMPPKVAPALRKAVIEATLGAVTNEAAMAALAARLDGADLDLVAGGLHLLACTAGGRAPEIARASALSWSKSLMWVMDDCAPELLRAMLRPLAPAIGTWSMVADLAEILDHVPPASDRFVDDPHAEMQLVPAADDGARALLVCLCGRQGRIGMPVSLFHRWAGGPSRHALYLRGQVEGDYRNGIPAFGPGHDTLTAFVRDLAAALRVDHVGVYGNSGGGFPAARLGLSLDARRIVVAGGTTQSLDMSETPAARERGRRALAREIGGLIAASRGESELVCIYSADNDGDRADAGAIAGLRGVRPMPLRGDKHNVARHLARAGTLGRIVDWAAGGQDRPIRRPAADRATTAGAMRRIAALPDDDGPAIDIVATLDRLAREAPDALAIVQPDGRGADFATLARESLAIAGHLATDTPAPAIFLGPVGPRHLAAEIACLRTGRPFVGLDPGTSPLRLTQMALASGADTLIHDGRDGAGAAAAMPRLRRIDLDALDRTLPPAPAVPPRDGDAAFVVFTSGSTGVPKGVAQTVGSLASTARLQVRVLDIRAGDRVALVSPAGVLSAPVFTMFGIAAGARLLLASDADSPAALLGMMARERATHLLCYIGIARVLCAHPLAPAAFATLRTVQVYGDVIGGEDCGLLRGALPAAARIHLLYGSSESNLTAGWMPSADADRLTDRLPIGHPLPGIEAWLRAADASESGALDGAAPEGELYVAGPRVSVGYWRDAASTRARRIPHPDDPARTLLAMGDIVRRRPDGMLEFVGRADNQVKLRGWRIEIEEIEAAARRLPGVRAAGVAVRRNRRGIAEALALHVVGDATADAVSLGLGAALPPHMVPARVILRPDLPLTATGKIDRVRLAEIDQQAHEAQDRMAAGSPAAWPDALSARIAAAIAAEIRRPSIAPHQRPNDAGIDSLDAINVALRIEKQFAVSIAPDDLMGTRTMGEIVAEMAAKAAGR